VEKKTAAHGSKKKKKKKKGGLDEASWGLTLIPKIRRCVTKTITKKRKKKRNGCMSGI